MYNSLEKLKYLRFNLTNQVKVLYKLELQVVTKGFSHRGDGRISHAYGWGESI